MAEDIEVDEKLAARFAAASDLDELTLIVDPDGAADGKITVDKAEYDQLQKLKGASGVNDAVSRLAEVLAKNSQQPINMAAVQPQQGETDAEFEKRIETELFQQGKSAGAIKSIVERYVRPIQESATREIADLRSQLAKHDDSFGPVVKKYGAEVSALLATLTPAQQATQVAQQWAVDQVRLKHFDELVEEKVKERSAAAGTKPVAPKSGSAGQPPHIERGAGAGIDNGESRRTVQITKKQEAEWTELARRNHMEPQAFVRRMAARQGGK